MKVKSFLVLFSGAVFCMAQGTSVPEGSSPPPPEVAKAAAEKTGTKKPALPGDKPAADTASGNSDQPRPPASVPAPAAARDPEPPPTPLPGIQPRSAEPAGATKRYVIGALDVLFVRVWNNTNLTGLVDVRPDGMISMPLVGEVRADGLTVEQFKDALRTRLSDYFANIPEVDVQVTKINSKKYYVIGEVLKQGEFPLVGETTVLDALSNAGGFKDFANLKKIYVLRGSQKLMFNYKDVRNAKHLEQNIKLEPGDRIFVP
jgi:polysaccharide export outer membrane protein